VTLGSGAGGGFILDGEIYHGHKPVELEIGHIRLMKDGTILESKCSGWAVDQKIRDYVKVQPDSILAGLVGPDHSGESKYLASAIEKGDEGAERILEETADDLAFGLSHVVHLIHPGVIILGGGLSLLGNLLKKAVEQSLQGYLMKAIEPPEIRLAELQEDAVCMGAALLAKTYLEK
jgi:glucokinase